MSYTEVVTTVYLGLGTNLVDRAGNLCSAIAELRATSGITVTRESSVIETEPWGITDQPKFLNQVIELSTTLEPLDLFHRLKAIERALGRDPAGAKWGPRVIDLDILFYDDLVLDSSELTIPHPRLHERRFVLEPLAELAPDFIHPVLKQTVAAMLSSLPLADGSPEH